MDKLKASLDAAEREVANHSIYVWAASGQLCKDINEKWIREHESRSDGGKHADDAVAAWREVMDSPYASVARAFDCSGYVSYCLMQAQALDKRRDCDGLYERCEATDELIDGTLLFRVNPQNPNDETHVGVYIGGLQYHAKGRCFGVVKESYSSKYWHKAAWFKALPKDEPQPEPPEPKVLIKVKGSVRVRDGNGAGNVQIGTAHNAKWYKEHGINKPSDTFPLIRQCEEYPYWYCIEYKGQIGYITSLPRYTEVIEK